MSEDDGHETHDIQSVIELCIQLQEKVKNLESKIKLQEERIKTLETEHTKHKMHNMNAPSDRSRDQAEEGVSGQSDKADQGTQSTPSQPGDDRQLRQLHSKPKAETVGGSVDDGVPKQPSNVSPGLKVAPSHPATLSSTQKDGPVPVPRDGSVAAKKDGPGVS